jgi:cation diffusion facilitator CzcD-associated flavoprotein CzcO
MTLTSCPIVDHEVLVVGAGFSGLGAGIKLREAGFYDFAILEQAADLGGTVIGTGASAVQVVPSIAPSLARLSVFQRLVSATPFSTTTTARARTYYFDHHGDAPFMRPSSGLELWWRSRYFNLDHYRFGGTP